MPVAAAPPPALVVIMPMTTANQAALAFVQDRVNSRVTFATDMSTYGQEEYWAVAKDKGDCEDYALAKLKMLRAMGWPKGSLDIAIGAYMGEWHTMLIAHTDEGDIALDNTELRPVRWRMLTGYTWLMTSTGGSFRSWRKIEA